MTAVEISDECDSNCDIPALSALCAHLLAALRLHPDCELSIVLVDEERMSGLHEDWMQEPGPTDVLSFPMDELRSAEPGVEPVPGILGDIVLCPAVAARQAQANGRTLDGELQFLVTHGMLHLIGYDHATQADYDAMFSLQDELLAGWAR